MSGLLIPFALDRHGQVVAPLTATPGGTYTCLDCGARVGLRKSAPDPEGKKRTVRAHFFHLSDTPCNGTGESFTHKAAKRVLKERCERELRVLGGLKIAHRCKGFQGHCRKNSVITQLYPLPETHWDQVELEVAHPPHQPAGYFRFDVAVTLKGQVVLGLEVYHRHLVPLHKAESLKVPWYEFVAEDILEARPLMPHGVRDTGELCEDCLRRQDIDKIRKKEQQRRKVVQDARDEQHRAFHPEFEQMRSRWEWIISRKALQDLKGESPPQAVQMGRGRAAVQPQKASRASTPTTPTPVARVEPTPQQLAVRFLDDLKIKYWNAKNHGLKFLWVPCPACGQTVAFVGGQAHIPFGVAQDFYRILEVQHSGGHVIHMLHVCRKCQARFTYDFFDDLVRMGSGVLLEL